MTQHTTTIEIQDTPSLRPRICVYSPADNPHVCTSATGAYAVPHPVNGGPAGACGPCFAERHGAGAPHGHPVGRMCPVCAAVKGARSQTQPRPAAAAEATGAGAAGLEVATERTERVIRTGFITDPFTHITERERAILLTLAAGHTVVTAARQLDLSVSNLEAGMRDLRNRWGCATTLSAVVHAVAIGVFSVDDIRNADKERQGKTL